MSGTRSCNYSCLLCDLSLPNGLAVTNHYKTEHGGGVMPTSWPCKLCPTQTTSRQALYSHRRTVHCNHETRDQMSSPPKKGQEILTSTSLDNILCLLCNEKFPHAFAMSKHYQSGIHGPCPITCWPCNFPGCMKSFSYRRSLYFHRKCVHKNDKNVSSGEIKIQRVCLLCNQEFPHNNAIGHHYSTVHSNTTEWKCYFCPKIYDNMSSLRVHRRVHHKDHLHR